MNRIALRETAYHFAVDEIGVGEVGGNNRGPRVEKYLSSVRLPPGQPWCAAFVYWCYEQAAGRLGMRNPLPLSGKCARLWQRSPTLWLSAQPSLYAIAIRLNNPEDVNTPGHCGFVMSGDAHNVATIEGNTEVGNDQDGGGVMIRNRPPRYWTGYIDIAREGPIQP